MLPLHETRGHKLIPCKKVHVITSEVAGTRYSPTFEHLALDSIWGHILNAVVRCWGPVSRDIVSKHRGKHDVEFDISVIKIWDMGMLLSLVEHWFGEGGQRHGCTGYLKSLTLPYLQELSQDYSRERDEVDGSFLKSAPGIESAFVINNPYDVYPRRLWDLHNNRVIPAYLFSLPWLRVPVDSSEQAGNVGQSSPAAQFPDFVAISHSWRSPTELKYVETPINHCAWPVPIPESMTLDQIRNEVRAAFPDIRYGWLDVLCLRQVDSRTNKSDHKPCLWSESFMLAKDLNGGLRVQELRIDVPTIGNIYQKASHIFRYYNGLGLSIRFDGWDNPTHWMNRAWTLQEYSPEKTMDGGVGNEFYNHFNMSVTRGATTKRLREFLSEISPMVKETSLVALAAEMGRRVASNEVDKIAGLSYLLRFDYLPTYSATEDIERVWQRCLRSMPLPFLAELFFSCPLVENRRQPYGGPHWAPTWRGLQSCPPSFVPYPPLELARVSIHPWQVKYLPLATMTGNVDLQAGGPDYQFYVPTNTPYWETITKPFRFFDSHVSTHGTLRRQDTAPAEGEPKCFTHLFVTTNVAPCSAWVLLRRIDHPSSCPGCWVNIMTTSHAIWTVRCLKVGVLRSDERFMPHAKPCNASCAISFESADRAIDVILQPYLRLRDQ